VPLILNVGTRWIRVVSVDPGKQPPVSIEQEDAWGPETVWTLWRREKRLNPLASELFIF
jgi:hypothetical protein